MPFEMLQVLDVPEVGAVEAALATACENHASTVTCLVLRQALVPLTYRRVVQSTRDCTRLVLVLKFDPRLCKHRFLVPARLDAARLCAGVCIMGD